MVSRDSRLLHLIAARGIQNGPDALLASRKAGIPLSAALALLTLESGGRNIFGADSGQPNALPRVWYDTHVTRLKYLYFRRRRRRGYVSNGVGPCQLTDATEQERADKLGGCYKPYYNMIVGFTMIRQLVAVHGWQLGFQHYNGSGPAAERYGANAVVLIHEYHSLFKREGLA